MHGEGSIPSGFANIKTIIMAKATTYKVRTSFSHDETLYKKGDIIWVEDERGGINQWRSVYSYSGCIHGTYKTFPMKYLEEGAYTHYTQTSP